MTDYSTDTWKHKPRKRPSFLARHWQNAGLVIVTVTLFLVVADFAGYVIDKANYDAEHSWKLREMK